MNAPLKHVYPEMQELHVSNHLLDDREGLRAAWERDGYWFFRDVLNREAIGAARQQFMDYLDRLRMADRNDPKALFKGRLPENYSFMVEELARRRIAQTTIMNDAKINGFFERLFGCAPFWVPFTVYRAGPPTQDRSVSRFDMIHEDGIYNDGLDFLICWIPLAEIDTEVGGIAVAEGLHHGPCLHRKDGIQIIPIEDDAIPAEAWRHTTYRAGDVLLMSLRTPHSGLANYSDRFRLSIDTRIMPSSGKTPIVGELTAMSLDGLTVKDAQGERTLRLDDASYCRGQRGNRILRPDLLGEYHPGSEVIIAFDGDRVVNMRPQH